MDAHFSRLSLLLHAIICKLGNKHLGQPKTGKTLWKKLLKSNPQNSADSA